MPRVVTELYICICINISISCTLCTSHVVNILHARALMAESTGFQACYGLNK